MLLAAGALQFSAATYSALDSAGTAILTVSRTGGSTGAVSVQYATSSGTAASGVDYTATTGTLNFVDGQTNATISVPILGDPNPDGGETVNLTLTGPTGGATLGAQSSTVLTINDIPGSLQFSAPTYSVVEKAGFASITVTRALGNGGPVTVNYTTTDGTAKNGTDYTTTTGTLSFADGVNSQTINVPILGDTNPDGSETVNLTLSAPTGGAVLGVQTSAVLTIQDVPGTLQFSAPTYTVNEYGGAAIITVTRTLGNSGPVSIQYTTSAGTGRAGIDYLTQSGTLNFPDGATSGQIVVPILGDPNPDGNETVNLALSNPSVGALLGAQATAVLTILDSSGTLQFSAPAYSVLESGGTATVTVVRNGGNAGAVTVNYATSNGSAQSGTDYTTSTGTLNFADGQNSATFTVPIANDPNPDGAETVNLTLSSPTGGVGLGVQTTSVLTINDVPGTLQFSAPTYTVSEFAGTATITVTRALGNGGPVSVNYSTTNGTATAGRDFTTTSGTLNFADGVATRTFTVPVLVDPIVDGNETVNLTLSSPGGGASLGTTSTAVLTIFEDPGVFQFSAPTYQVSEQGPTVTLTVTRGISSGPGGAGPVAVPYFTSDGTATSGIDYGTTSGTLNFSDGQVSQTFTVPILRDTVPDGTETFSVGLGAPTNGGTLGANSAATVSILDLPGTLQFGAPTFTAVENSGTATITVTRAIGSGGPATVDYTTTDGTGRAGTDYGTTSGTLSFADGQKSATFTVPLLGDPNPDGPETVNLFLRNVTSPSGVAALGPQATAVLTIVDAPGALQFSAPAYSVTENGGTATITVTRTVGNGGPVSVNYTTSDGTARAGTDYATTAGTLNFADGQVSQTIIVPIPNDPNPDGPETVNLTLSSPTNGAGLGAQSTTVLTINDVPGALQFSAPSFHAVEGVDGTATITVTRSLGNGGPVTVNYATSDGTARSATDYTTTAGTLNFADGQNSATFAIPILNDMTYDGTETVNLTLSAPGGGASLAARKTAVLNIQDAPGSLQFSAPTYNVNETSASASILVTRTGGSGGVVSAQFTTSDGSAKNGTDYQTTQGTITFLDGVTTQTVVVPIVRDPINDGSETVNLSLTSPTGGASLGSQSTAVLSIADVPGSFQLAAPTYTVAESAGSLLVTVNRAVGNNGTVTVDYTTGGGTATAGIDYKATAGTLRFADNVNSQTIAIPILGDPKPDGPETFNLTLSNPTGGASLGSPTTSVVTITDVPGSLQLSAPTYSVLESAGSVPITVTRALGNNGQVSVNYTITDGTAKAGTDYSPPNGLATGTITLLDGVNSQTINVPILGDAKPDGNETFTIALSSPLGGASLGGQSSAVVTINDVPGSLGFSVPTATVLENAGSVTLTVTRSLGNGGAVSIPYSTKDGTATSGIDYKATSGVLNFADGVNSQTITVPLPNDPGPDGDETFTVLLGAPTGGASLAAIATTTVTIQETAASPAPQAPQLTALSDTGASSSDGITKNNGSTAAPLTFTIAGVVPANGFVNLFDISGGSPVPLAGPVQAVGGVATITLSGLVPLTDGTHILMARASATKTSPQSPPSAFATITIQTSLQVTGSNPANGGFVTSLPNGQVSVQFNHKLAGLVDGASPITASNPYILYVLPRGPSGVFAAPLAPNAGSNPLHANLVYHVHADGTSEIDITPTEPMSTDVYGISISSAFADLAGNILSDGQGNHNGVFSTFELRPTPFSNSALQVTSVSAFNGAVPINNNQVPQPDSIAVTFNKPLDILSVSSNSVHLLTPQGAGFLNVPAAVAYSPTTRSIYVTPTAVLFPGTTYVLAVDSSVSDDLGFPGPGFKLPAPFYTSFSVNAPAAGSGQSPLRVATDSQGNPQFLPAPTLWTTPVGYASVKFTEPVNFTSLNAYSVMLIPRSGGLDNSQFDSGDGPLNAQLAFNPNTNQIIIVPTQPVGDDWYTFSLGAIKAFNGDPLLNSAGQQAGVTGPPVYATFVLQAGSGQISAFSLNAPSVSVLETVAPNPLAAATGAAPGGPLSVRVRDARPDSLTFVRHRVAQSISHPTEKTGPVTGTLLSGPRHGAHGKRHDHAARVPSGPLGLGG